MSILTAEIQRTTRVIVTVDVEKCCATYAEDRAGFDGDDADFVRESLKIWALDLVKYDEVSDEDDGVSVEPDGDEIEVDVLGATT